MTLQKLEESKDLDTLVTSLAQLGRAQKREELTGMVRHLVRQLTDSDGSAFVVKEEDECHFIDEDAIAPLWKGRKFPLNYCLSGWTIRNRSTLVIEDIWRDPRVPKEKYQSTFVKSLAIVPIGKESPRGALGTYWAQIYRPDPLRLKLLEVLAEATAIVLENIELKRQIAVRDDLISVAAHELRNPLTPLSLQAQLMRKTTDMLPTDNFPKLREVKSFINNAVRQVGELGKLIDNLLDISRLRAGRFTMDIKCTDFSEIVETIAEQHRPFCKSPIELQVERNVVGEWDAMRLGQVVRNLLSNAISYGRQKPICLRLASRGDVAVLVVEDQGIGIGENDRKRIFQCFERATSLAGLGGLGLGLFVTKQIVTAHGGQIRVESEPGNGSRFIVELPKRRGEVRPPAENQQVQIRAS